VDTITLKGGLTVPVEALHLALDLEQRGFEMHVDGDRLRIALGRDTLNDLDREAIKKWKNHLLVVASYRCDHNFQEVTR